MITIKVDTARPGAKINPAMWGIFFEDINFGADGGLYAELVKNRSFEFPEPMMGWRVISGSSAASRVEVRTEDPFSEVQPHYLRLVADGAGEGTGVANEGFRGIG